MAKEVINNMVEPDLIKIQNYWKWLKKHEDKIDLDLTAQKLKILNTGKDVDTVSSDLAMVNERIKEVLKCDEKYYEFRKNIDNAVITSELVDKWEDGEEKPKIWILLLYSIKYSKEISEVVKLDKYFKHSSKKKNENWFIFFSGVIANIPINLLVSFVEFDNSASCIAFLAFLAAAFICSLLSLIFMILFTVNFIEVKKGIETARNMVLFPYMIEFKEINDVASGKADCNVDKVLNNGKFANHIGKLKKWYVPFCFTLILTLIFIVLMWLVKFQVI